MAVTDRSFRQTAQRWLGVLAVAAASCWFGVTVDARGLVPAEDTVALSALPPEAQQTQRLIETGGPFRYTKDGTVFGNRERLLPRRPRGHYREYTVPTPRSKDRGARRIVCAGSEPTRPDICYYTADHYASFQRIVP